jgi:zinc transporter 9
LLDRCESQVRLDVICFYLEVYFNMSLDAMHPYGFSKERTAYALVSGVGIFFLGGGVSMYHGISGLLSAEAHVIGDPTVAQWVLVSSLVFELGKAGRTLRSE